MKNCPSCGRPIEFEEKYAKIVACPYCNSILEYGKWEFTKIGEQWYFIEFPSQFKVRKDLNFRWMEIFVAWQLRYEYDWWFFDDFFVKTRDKTFYIREDDGQIFAFEEIYSWENDLTLSTKSPWNSMNFDWKNFYIEEIWIFHPINLRWDFPTKIAIWKRYEYLNWFYNWEKYFFEKEFWTNLLRICKEIKI